MKKKRENYNGNEKRKMAKIKAEREHKCYYCKRHISDKTKVTIDHREPYDGTNTTYDNCVIACESCNSEKGGKPEAIYYKFLEYRNRMSKLSKDELMMEYGKVVGLLRKGERYEGEMYLGHFAQALKTLIDKN